MTVTMFGGDLVTGLIKVRNIPVREASATQDLDAGAVGCSLTLPLVEPRTKTVLDVPSILVPGKSFLGFAVGDTIIECGPIWTDSYDFDSKVFQMKGAGLKSYFDYRFVLPVLTSGQLPSDVTSTWTTSLRTMAKRLVQQAQAWSPTLPIVFEDDVAGTNVRTYAGSDLMKVGDALTNLSSVIDGPDITLRAEFKDSQHVQWRVVTGSPELKQAGADHVWNMAVPGSSVKGTTLDRDGTVLSGQDYESGDQVNGVPAEALASDSTLTDAGYPMFETSGSHESATVAQTLQDYADAAVLTGRLQLETWGFQAHVAPTDGKGNKAGPWLGEYGAGDYARLIVPPNPRTAAGPQRMRIMSFDADLSDWVKVTVAPERASS